MRIVVVFLGISLTGCSSTVNLQYRDAGQNENVNEVISNANAGYEYVALSKLAILVSPIPSGKVAPASASASDASATADQSNSTAKASVASPKPISKTSAASGVDLPKLLEKAITPGSATPKVATTTMTGTQPATKSPEANSNGTPGTADSTAAQSPSTPQSSTKGATSPSDVLGNVFIDGNNWGAKVVPISDPSQSIFVKGVSGFWNQTTISISRYENSELISIIASKSENLVPQRLGQIATILATAIQVAAVFPVEDQQRTRVALKPFIIEVPRKSMESPQAIPGIDGWTFLFEYLDNGVIPGTLTLEQFKESVKGAQVSYFPVPACRAGKLSIFSIAGGGEGYAFYVTVSSPDNLRLQPLPVAGQIILGATCGASASGVIATDSATSFVDDITAAQKAIRTIQDVSKAGGSNTSSSTKVVPTSK